MKKKKQEPYTDPDTMTTEFDFMNAKFEGDIDPAQKEILSQIKLVVENLDAGPTGQGFNSWLPERLISAREKLSRYSEPLGEWISFHETRSDFAYIWRKGKAASEWQPIKSELAKALKQEKVTNVEVENEITKKFLEQQYYSMFHRRRADLLILELEAVDRMIRSIDSRLRELTRQKDLSYSSSESNRE